MDQRETVNCFVRLNRKQLRQCAEFSAPKKGNEFKECENQVLMTMSGWPMTLYSSLNIARKIKSRGMVRLAINTRVACTDMRNAFSFNRTSERKRSLGKTRRR